MAHFPGKLAAALSFVLVASCGIDDAPPIGPLEDFHQVVAAEEAASGRIALKFAAGELDVVAGGEALMELNAKFNVEDWRPEVESKTQGSEAQVSVRQGGDKHGMSSEHVNEWKVLVGTGRPLDFDFDFGIGRADVSLAGVTIRKVKVDSGIGKMTLDLSDVVGDKIDVEVDSGIGETTVRFSRSATVVADIDQGIGAVSREGFEEKDGRYHHVGASGGARIELNLDAGIGKVNLEFVD